MDAINTLFPVFFMLALGFVSRVKGWITPEQKDGANAIIFNLLFPIMIFNLMATVSINASHIGLILYAFIAMILAFVIGKLATGFTGKKYAAFSPYLISVMEGGHVLCHLSNSHRKTDFNCYIHKRIVQDHLLQLFCPGSHSGTPGKPHRYLWHLTGIASWHIVNQYHQPGNSTNCFHDSLHPWLQSET